MRRLYRAAANMIPQLLEKLLRAAVAILLLLAAAPAARAATGLAWSTDQRRLAADLEGWSLDQLLEQVGESTRWNVYVEPDTRFERPLSVKFPAVPTGEALRRLLGRINFALIPQKAGPANLYVFHTSVDEATRLVRTTKEPAARIRGEVIVRLKPGATESIEELARRLGAQIVGRDDQLKIYRLRFPDDASAQKARESLAQDPSVAQTDFNYAITNPNRPNSVPLASNAPLRLRPGTGPDSQKIIVALIDTAVQPGLPNGDFLLPTLAVAGESRVDPATPSHGTSMFETLMRGLSQAQEGQVESGVRVLPVDVYGTGEATTTYDVARGIYAAIEAGASIVNLSLGTSADSPLLQYVIRQGAQRGVVFVAAAGNEPTTNPTFPAAYPEVLAVTAGNRRGQIASYANRGDFVDVMGPGSNLIEYNGQSYFVSGTSAASAYIAGVAAGMAAVPTASTTNVNAALRSLFGVNP